MNKVIVYLAEIEYILGNYKESLMLYKKALLIFQYCKYVMQGLRNRNRNSHRWRSTWSST